MAGSELATIPRDSFALAWPGDYSSAATLTEIWLRSFKSHHTRVNYARDLRAWLAWCEACRVAPPHARRAHADMWIEHQREQGAADSSIARRLSAVASWYDHLIANTADDPVPLATRNPARTRARPKIDEDWSPTVGLSRTEANKLIGQADRHSATAAALIRLLLFDGLRIGSALAAQVEDLGYDRGHRVLNLEVKGGTKARVPIPPPVGEAVDVMLAERGNPASGALFMTRSGRRVYEMWAWRLVRLLGKRAGVPQWADLSPHSLRATAITEAMDAGMSLRDAQDFAMHKDPRTTRRYDKSRHNLDRHGSYMLATRFGERE